MRQPPPPSSLPHYAAHAAEYAAALLSHDTGEARARFLACLPEAADILDVGCGPGRDLAAFRDAGYRAVGLEGCPALAAAAKLHSGAEIWQQDLFTATLPPGRFDGIWLQAVLFHVPGPSLPEVLARLRGTLRPGGILYACDPTGRNEEGWVGDRYLAFRLPQSLHASLRAAGFTILESWRRPPGRPRRQQSWLATLARRGD